MPDHHNAITSLLDGLDQQQLEAVRAPAAPLVVIAGAGSGKTTTLTRRIAFQVLRGDVPAKNVLAVTHTTKAAGEIRDRLIGVDSRFAEVSCMTVHAAAWKVVRQFHREVGFETQPELVSSTLPLVRQALRAVGKTSLESAEIVDLAAEFEWAGAWGVVPDTYVDEASKAGRNPPLSLKDTAAAFEKYRGVKRAQNCIDFADLLELGVQVLTNPVLAARVHNAWQAVVVDEYQDTDRAQARFLSAVRAGRPLWTVVGDPRQTIYSFKGADPGLLREAMRERGATVVNLSTSWRCSSEILSWANAVIGSTYGPKLSSTASGPVPSVRSARDENDEIEQVLTMIRSWRSKGIAYTNMGILFRFNASAARIEAALTDAAIPYQVLGAPRFLERPEVLEVLRIFGASARQDGEQDGVELLAWAASQCGFVHSEPPSSQGALRARWESIRALLELGAQCSDSSAGGMLDEFLSMVRTGTSLGVTLATIHAAKGLEWDAVIVTGAAEGTIPSTYATSAVQVEEERRLFYVALTRARRELCVTYPASFKRRPLRPSRFLSAIPDARHVTQRQSQQKKYASRGGSAHVESNRARLRSKSSNSAQHSPSAHNVEAKAAASRSISDLGNCERCLGRLAGLPARTARRCSPECLDGDLAVRWSEMVAWRSALAASPTGEVPKISDRALFRYVVMGSPGPGWPKDLKPPR